jgi:disulfide bond formation protein DsbB
MNVTRQCTLLIAAGFSLAAVAIALVSQHVFDMQPCAWCVLQRLIYLAIALVCLIGAAGGAIVARVAALLAAALGVAGVATAWYQHAVASKLLSCDMTFADRFMSHSGLDGAIPSVFGIFASCMDAVVVVGGLEFSVWSLILFVLLSLSCLWVALRPSKR